MVNGERINYKLRGDVVRLENTFYARCFRTPTRYTYGILIRNRIRYGTREEIRGYLFFSFFLSIPRERAPFIFRLVCTLSFQPLRIFRRRITLTSNRCLVLHLPGIIIVRSHWLLVFHFFLHFLTPLPTHLSIHSCFPICSLTLI